MKNIMMNKVTIILMATALLVVGIVINNKQIVIEQINQDFSSAPPAAGGTNYYVCDTGDDTNSGLSELTPFQSFGKAMTTFNTMNGGDSVLFCRGGVFPAVANRLMNAKCSETAMCTISDYGDTNKERPQMIANDIIGLNFQDGGNADPDGGYAVRNLILMSSSQSKVGIFFYNDADDIILDNLHVQGFRIGIYPGGSNTLNSGVNGKVDRLVLKNSTIIDNVEQGWFGGCNDCLIEDNLFENNGFSRKILNHNIYLASGNRMTLRGNTLYKSAIVDGKCTGVSLVAHGIISDLTIENNIIKEDVGAVSGYCWGIGVDPGYSSEEVFTNVIIRNNKLLNVGNIAIECSSCDGALIDGNTIIDEGNVLKAGIAVPGKPEDTIKSRNITISNNTILLSKDNGLGVRVGGENSFEVNNNKISQPEITTVECIARENANIDTDISSNACSKHTEIQFIDSSTGEVISSSDVTIVDVNVADTTTTDTTTADTTTTDTTTADTTTTDTTTADTTTTDTSTTDIATVDTSTTDTTTTDTTSLSDYETSKKGKKSPLDRCRATANDRCIMK